MTFVSLKLSGKIPDMIWVVVLYHMGHRLSVQVVLKCIASNYSVRIALYNDFLKAEYKTCLYPV